MRNAYIFLYDHGVGDREKVKDVIRSMKRVYTWRFDMPNCFYVISDYSSKELYQEFVEINGTKGRFMFVEAGNNRYGMMLPETWYLLTNKSHKPKNK